jgi:hypothetical protein
MGLGTSPDSSFLSFLLEPIMGMGIAAIKAWVYGCLGVRQISLSLFSSTTFPKYITAIRSAMCSTTPKSCEIKR